MRTRLAKRMKLTVRVKFLSFTEENEMLFVMLNAMSDAGQTVVDEPEMIKYIQPLLGSGTTFKEPAACTYNGKIPSTKSESGKS
jgi:hypothetical protein